MSNTINDTIRKVQEGIAARQLQEARDAEPRDAFMDWLIQSLSNYANAGAKKLTFNYENETIFLESNYAFVDLTDICSYIYGYTSTSLFKETPAIAVAFSPKYTLRFAVKDEEHGSVTVRVLCNLDFKNTDTLLESFDHAISCMHVEVPDAADFASLESRNLEISFSAAECLEIFARYVPYLMAVIPGLEEVTIRKGDTIIEHIVRLDAKKLQTECGLFTLECTTESMEARVRVIDRSGRPIHRNISSITMTGGTLGFDRDFTARSVLPINIKER